MQIEVHTIADAATISGGKLNILGAFDHLFARSFPAHHRSCCVVTKFRAFEEDSGEHEFEIHIIDPDGKDVIEPARGKFEFEIGFEHSGHHTHLWEIQGFALPKPGVFYIDAILDGVLLNRTPLFVRQVDAPPVES